MIVALASRKASPGTTTLTALLAAYWYEPGSERLVVEADPSGGTLAARWSNAHGLSWDPGLLSLSTTRSRLDAGLLPSISQPLADAFWVAAAPPAPDQVRACLARMGDTGAAALAGAADLATFVDCGRLTSSSPALPLAQRAAMTILVCRPRLDEVHALVPAVSELSQAGCSLGLVCVGDGPYPPSEVARTLATDLLAVLPVDDRACAALDREGFRAGRVLRRSALVRAVEELAGLIRSRCAGALEVVMELHAVPARDVPPPVPAERVLGLAAPDDAVPVPSGIEASDEGHAGDLPDESTERPESETVRPGEGAVDHDELPVSLAMLAARASMDGRSDRSRTEPRE